MEAIVNNEELPEPYMKSGSLDEVELSYKSIGLHLLFLYRLGRKTETYYWERLRKEMSDEANDFLRSEIKAYKKNANAVAENYLTITNIKYVTIVIIKGCLFISNWNASNCYF